MRTCEACGRDFGGQGRSQECPYCDYNNNRWAPTPRSQASLRCASEEAEARSVETTITLAERAAYTGEPI